jgi:hypothetical protein
MGSNLQARIAVQQTETGNEEIFDVYADGGHWRRVESLTKRGDALWLEANPSKPAIPASSLDEVWLTEIYERRREHKEVRRFPRTSEWLSVPRFDPRNIAATNWLIENLLVEGSIQLIFGPPGSYKTTVCYYLAKIVSSGQTMDGIKVPKRRVIIFDFENPSAVIAARCKELGLGLPENDDLIIWDRFSEDALRPDNPRLEKIVKVCIEETGHGPWIIFDSWSSLLADGQGGETTGQIAPIYTKIRKLVDLGATCTVLDHSKKYDEDSIYGGHDKIAKADTIHGFRRFENPVHPHNPIVTITSRLKRYSPAYDCQRAFKISSRRDDQGHWHIAGIEATKNPEEIVRDLKNTTLCNLIRQNPTAGKQQLTKLAAESGQMSRDEASELLDAGESRLWTTETKAHGKLQYRLL